MSQLDINDLGKRYGRVTALAAVSLTIRAGSRVAIIGPSGSGKTSLLRLIAGFERPDSGTIHLDGRLIADRAGLVPAHRRDIGLVAQDGALFPHLTVGENIGFGLSRRQPDRMARIAALLDTVELPRSFASRQPHQLSGGQQQRVALARALARQPKLMLLDEPFSALDTGLRASLRKAVAAILTAAGMTTILVTHDQEEALSFADHIAVLRQGRLVQDGAPADLYRAPCDPDTARLLGPAIILPAQLAGDRADCALGTVAISRPAGQGRGDILLRPEQIRLSRATDGPAVVTEREYGGGISLLTVKIQNTSLTIRCFDPAPPAPGERVSLTLTGPAHAFRAGEAPA